MTQISPTEQSTDPQTGWVAMWRKAVRASGAAVALIELPTTRFAELSPASAQLLGTTPAEGAALTYRSIAEQPWEVAETARLVMVGMLNGVRARARFRRRDGSMVEAESIGWVIRSRTGREMGLWVFCAEDEHARLANELSMSSSLTSRHGADDTWVTIDDHWRMAHVSRSTRRLLGHSPTELLGESLIDLAHPDDMGILLLGLARATTESGVRVRVRLRHRDGGWYSSYIWPTLLEGEETLPFAVVIADDDAVVTASASGQRVQFDAGTLQVSREVAPDPMSRVGLDVSFSTRQREILTRLVQGERVRDIAAALYLSPATVRNHLTAIYHKVGVHSQTELLAMMLNSPDPRNPTK
jgi:PAS domain S-box-containing protein